MYAIIQTGGKQYKVSEGDIVFIEKLEAEVGDTVDFSDVLFIKNEDASTIGTPYIDNAKVTASVLDHGKGKKLVVFKYRSKKDSKCKQGHRQPFTKLEIKTIEG